MTDLVKRAMFRVTQGNVSNLDTLDLVQLPLSLIDVNEGNFYAVEDIQDLKDSIALIGLQQPLVVLPVDGRYRLIAGHRRYKALYELGKETAPCVIQSGLTETEEQLALILTNSTTRDLSYSEKMEQAKQLKELFVKRREEGAELPGRIRDIVADAMNESASNIARMEATDKHLISEWRQDLNAYDISQSAAYELSKLPEDVQHKLKAEYPRGTVITAQIIKSAAKTAQNLTKIVRKSEQVSRERADAEAEAKYMQSAYRRAQLSLIQWAQDPRWDAMQPLPYIVKFYRDMVTEPRRNQWSPNLQDLFDLADMMQISVSELLGIAREEAAWKI